MRRLFLCGFWTLQILGLVCLSGGESLAVTRIGFIARFFAVIVLEPGFVVMRTVFEYFLFPSAFTTKEQFWLGAVSAVAVNALFFLMVLSFIRNIRLPKERRK